MYLRTSLGCAILLLSSLAACSAPTTPPIGTGVYSDAFREGDSDDEAATPARERDAAADADSAISEGG